MFIDKQGTLRSISKVTALAIPCLISIAILELVNAEIYFYGPFSEQENMFMIWNLFQLIPAFAFGYFSDRNYRKEALVISQILGLIGGIILYYFGIKPWVLILIALLFNPMPVARAALLDNFPQHSTLKLVAITFLAQNFPWVFFNQIGTFSLDSLIIFTLILMIANTIFTIFLFEDRKDLIHSKVSVNNTVLLQRSYRKLFYILIAFTASELTFYLVWAFIEHSKNDFVWLDFTTFGTLIGISSAMLYNRLPHISVITLFYTIGFGITLVAILTCKMLVFNCETSLLSAISHYCVVGGMYLPFVTEAVINMAGTKHKAVGAAMVESGDTIAIVIAPLIISFMKETPTSILYLIAFLYLLAFLIQMKAERTKYIMP